MAVNTLCSIYAVRYTLTAIYDYRLNSNQTYLDSLNQQRNDAIEKFKSATKYNSTQELLQKYGAAPAQPSTPKSAPTSAGKRKSGANDTSKQSTPQRTGLPPPPTANIRRPPSGNFSPEAPSGPPQPFPYPQQTPPRQQQRNSLTNSPVSPDISASFAPNAFTSSSSAPPQYSESSQRQWYDRIFDVILGEDETRASNRIALVCQHCKLVNGQAPPGVKRMEDVGRWRCAECRGWNGVETEVHKILEVAKAEESPQEMSERSKDTSAEDDASTHAERMANGTELAADPNDLEPEQHEEVDADGAPPPARSTRSRKKKSEDGSS